MVEKEFTIQNEVGLHARPAARLIKVAGEFESEISIIKNGKTANAKSLLSVLAMGIFKGNKITIKIDGPDEISALYSITKLFDSNFPEDDY